MKEMMVLHDEDVRGNRLHTVRLVNDEDSLTVEALIRLRVNNEVTRFNTQRPICFFSLVQPKGVDITARGYRLKEHRDIDSQAQPERREESLPEEIDIAGHEAEEEDRQGDVAALELPQDGIQKQNQEGHPQAEL